MDEYRDCGSSAHYKCLREPQAGLKSGARVKTTSDLPSRGQNVKVKVMSIGRARIGLSMKDVKQATGRDLTPHLRIKSEAEMEEGCMHTTRASLMSRHDT
ncbi:DEAH-box ATP-dependent RNA helicase prp22 [Marasmius tenuissimus]|uniref:DEAH-box ATP-dependent RNA helicase prp22 n=1 Tax=Marasmius tenuissimus TaxID=585030 RepID=A0ABR2Z824_9AGAR